MVTAQEIQKVDATIPDSDLVSPGKAEEEEVEKSNIDMLNIDYVQNRSACCCRWSRELDKEYNGNLLTATSIAGRNMIPSTAMVAMDELSNFAALAIPTFVLLSFCETTEYI